MTREIPKAQCIYNIHTHSNGKTAPSRKSNHSRHIFQKGYLHLQARISALQAPVANQLNSALLSTMRHARCGPPDTKIPAPDCASSGRQLTNRTILTTPQNAAAPPHALHSPRSTSRFGHWHTTANVLPDAQQHPPDGAGASLPACCGASTGADPQSNRP